MGMFDCKGTGWLLFSPACMCIVNKCISRCNIWSKETLRVFIGLAMTTHLPSLRTLFSNESLTEYSAEPDLQEYLELF